MKDRFITLSFALLALLLTWILLVPPSQPARQISLPTTEDSGKEGLKGLKSWLEQVGVPLSSLRRRYDSLLNEHRYVSRGNLLILSLPQNKSQQNSDWRPLVEWLGNGNTVLILAAEYHHPNWSNGYEWRDYFDQLGWALGWKTEPPEETQTSEDVAIKENVEQGQYENPGEDLIARLKAIKPEATRLRATAPLPVMSGVRYLQGDTSALYTQAKHDSLFSTNQFAVRLAYLADTGQTALWQFPVAQGSLYLSLLPDLLSNAELGRADNARFIMNLINSTLSNNGKVIFDDFHFGLSELYDEKQFFGDSRLHYTLLFIGAIWLLYVVGHTNRLAPVKAATPRAAEIDYVNAMAGFFAGHINRRTLARELVKHLLLEIQAKRHPGDEQEVWRWLQNHPALQRVKTSLLLRAGAGDKIKLITLSKTINEIRTRVL